MKIGPVGEAELLHADGRTDGRKDGRTDGHGESSIRFSQFCASAYKVREISCAVRIMGKNFPATDSN